MSTKLREKMNESIENIALQNELSTISQSCRLEIENDGTLNLITEHLGEDGVCESVWNGVTRSIGLPSGVRPASLAVFLNQHLPELDLIVNGMHADWKDDKYVGTITDEAEEAITSLFAENLNEQPKFEVIHNFSAGDYYEMVFHSIEAQPTEAMAISHALEGFDSDGINRDLEINGNSMFVWVDPDEIREYAREIWKAAQARNNTG